MSIYSQPTKVLMREFAKERLAKGQLFEKKDAIAWFAQHYPNIKSNTVAMHVEGMAINSRARKHHVNVKPGSGHDLFFKVGPGKFRLWIPETDPEPLYREKPSTGALLPQPGSEHVDETDNESMENEDPASTEFAFERDLRNYLAKNLGSIEKGLKLYQDEEFSGVEFPVGGRFIDILAVSSKGEFVVIELKVSRGYDRVVGQLLRYMAWVRKNIAQDTLVRGIILAREITDDLRLAASLIPDVQLAEYELSFKLKQVTQ